MSTENQSTSENGSAFFGFKEVEETAKQGMVHDVFRSVADRYDLMNDVMSAGTHRVWKQSLIDQMRPKNGERLLDVAGGTGDIAFKARGAAPKLDVTVCDINEYMLGVGKERAAEDPALDGLDFVCGNAEALPVPSRSYDIYSIAFGIRNVTHIDRALRDAHRALKPGGRFFILEFSPSVFPALKKTYDTYSFNLIPRFGELFAGNRDSYQYLVESIRQFPEPDRLKALMEEAGFSRVTYRSLSFGVVYIHQGWRL